MIPRPVNRGNRHLFLTQSTDSYRKSTSLMRTLRSTVCCNKTFFLPLAELKWGFCEDSTYKSVCSGFHNMTCLISVADPHLQIRGRGGHPDPEIRGKPGLKKTFRHVGPQFDLKRRGGRAPPAPPLDPPLNMDTPLVWTLIAPSARCPF